MSATLRSKRSKLLEGTKVEGRFATKSPFRTLLVEDPASDGELILSATQAKVKVNTAGDDASAHALRNLAEKREYDAPAGLLEEAWAR